MSANDFSLITPRLLAGALKTIQTNCIMPRLVNRSYNEIAGRRGTTVDIIRPVPFGDPADVVPSHQPLDSDGLAPDVESIRMNNWNYQGFHMTDKEKLEVMDGVFPMQAAEAVKSICKAVDTSIFNAAIRGFYGKVGTPGTSPFASDFAVAAAARKLLNEQDAPDTDRYGVIDTTADYNAIQLAAFRDASQSSDNGPIIKGMLGEKVGFDWLYSNRVPTHTPGTAIVSSTITTVANNPIKSKSVILKVAASTGTLVVGDIISFAGHSQTYVVTAPATLNTTGVSVSIEPGLKVAVNGTGTAVAVTGVKSGASDGAYTANFAFNRNAIALVSRPMEGTVERGLGVVVDTMVEPMTQLLVRLIVTRQTWQTLYTFDVLWGTEVIRPEFGVRIAG